MNYREKILNELKQIPEERYEELFQVVRTFRRQFAYDWKSRQYGSMAREELEKPYASFSTDWEEATMDPYYALMKIREVMRAGNFTDAHAGIEVLYRDQTQGEKDLLQDALKNVMEAIILWKESDAFKTEDNIQRINEGRDDIDLQIHEYTPVDEQCIDEVWDEAFRQAVTFAEIQLQRKVKINKLTHYEVFEEEFSKRAIKKQIDE